MKKAEILEQDEINRLWNDYQNGLAYQVESGMSNSIPKYVKFYEGDQWAPPTKNTKNLPRPVVNVIKMICRNKKSAILSTPVKLKFETDNKCFDEEKFNDFANFVLSELDQESLDKLAIEDAVKKGTYIYHYYWDSEKVSRNGAMEGGLACEIIDPLSIFFANPNERDEQKQKWILIVSREDVSSVIAKCDKDVDKTRIVPDDFDGNYQTLEQKQSGLCTVLTKYFRKNGEVFVEKATKTVLVNKPFALTPDIQFAKRELGLVDSPNNSLPDDVIGASLIPLSTKARLYPIVVGNYEPREKSIFGIGEIEGLIPNQKAINFNLAMSLFNAQENAWGKYVVLPNALAGQVINNEPGQVLIDYSATGNGIKKLAESQMSSQPLELVDKLASLTRVVTGSTEVMTGEAIGANMSGTAIAQLQSYAKQPVDELRESFWFVKKKQGRIIAQFLKLYYFNKSFPRKIEIANNSKNENILKNDAKIYNLNNILQKETIIDLFSSDAFYGAEFNVSVVPVSGVRASSAGDISALDALLDRGLISLRTYLLAYPEDALSNKEKLLKLIDAEKASVNNDKNNN